VKQWNSLALFPGLCPAFVAYRAWKQGSIFFSDPKRGTGMQEKESGDNTTFCSVLWRWCLECGMASQTLARANNKLKVFSRRWQTHCHTVQKLREEKSIFHGTKEELFPFSMLFCASQILNHAWNLLNMSPWSRPFIAKQHVALLPNPFFTGACLGSGNEARNYLPSDGANVHSSLAHIYPMYATRNCSKVRESSNHYTHTEHNSGPIQHCWLFSG